MNHQIRTLGLIAFTAAVPLALLAQSQTPSSSTPSASTSSTAQAMASSADSLGSSNAGLLNIRRVSNEMVDHQFTAKTLIGKDVYDNHDKKIGEVKDIVLDSNRAPQLAGAMANKAAGRMSTGVATAGNSSPATAGTNARVNDADTRRLAQADALASGMMPAESSAIVSFGGFMGVGHNLLQVPLSQLRYDSSRDHITLNVTATELSSLKETTDTVRSATE